MIKKTTDYDLFVFREDNRARIIQNHVRKLADSMRARCMLDICPIKVNEKMEIIDGQHRMLAAKSLGLPIYYEIIKTLGAEDMIRMNISKSWGAADYLNFYCQHNYESYLKLKRFMDENNINLKVAMNIVIGESKLSFEKFREGEFVYQEENLGTKIEICWETIRYIKKMNGHSPFTGSARFWKALIKMVTHPDFELSRWTVNVQKQVDHFCARARTEDYIRMVQKIYNWKNPNKIVIVEEDT